MYRQKHLIITGMVHADLAHLVSVGVFIIARCCDTCKPLYLYSMKMARWREHV